MESTEKCLNSISFLSFASLLLCCDFILANKSEIDEKPETFLIKNNYIIS